jgi:prophage maintenance system killer protein
MPDRLSFEDLMKIAAGVLGLPTGVLEGTVCIFRAESSLAAPFARAYGVDLHPDPVERAVICALRVIRSRPFLEGNTEIAYACMRLMLWRSNYLWLRQSDDADETAETLKQLEKGPLNQRAFLRWVREGVRKRTGLEDGPTA